MTDTTVKLRELLAKATPGPWEWRDDQMSVPEWPVVQWTISPGVLIADTNNGTPGGDEIDQANAALIVAAVNALPSLLDTIERMQCFIGGQGLWNEYVDESRMPLPNPPAMKGEG